MKKHGLALALTCMAALALAGCGTAKSTETTAASSSAAETTEDMSSSASEETASESLADAPESVTFESYYGER